MIITYIGHSGFMAELPHCILLFDVLASEEKVQKEERHDIGHLPPMDPEKWILVFVSHAHRDHYSHGIWELRKKYPRIRYFLGKGVPLSRSIRERYGITDQEAGTILRCRPEQKYTLQLPGPGELHIETLQSTDEGVAYLVEAEGKTFYHAGDLHLWLWEEEGAGYMEKMEADFFHYTAPLRGRAVDAAFLPLDDRLEEHTYDGMDVYLDMMQVSHCFPMHMWKHYELIPQYKEARKEKAAECEIHEITYPGQSFSIPETEHETCYQPMIENHL